MYVGSCSYDVNLSLTSIHPFSTTYLGLGHVGSNVVSKGPMTSVFGHLHKLLRWDTGVFPGQLRDIISLLCPGSTPESPPTKAYPNHLILVYSESLPGVWAPTSFLRQSPETLWRKFISAFCIHGLVLLVTTHS